MKMSFDDYISNPMGTRNSVISNRNMYKEMYRNKLDKILVREVGKVKYELYHNKDRYFIHFKIPSEVIPKFYYDTVIEFYTDESAYANSKNLKKYYSKFYSNDPSFVYTFAYAFLENDIFIRELIPRMSKAAVKKVATEKNPKREVGYVKSLYFAYLLMNNYNLFDKIEFSTYGKKYSKKALLDQIMNADEKIADRKEASFKVAKKKKREKRKTSKARMNDMRNLRNTANGSKFAKTSKVISGGGSSKANRAKTVKKI